MGNAAIEEAGKDLAACYQEALDIVLKKLLEDKKEKNIAFSTLGADVGFPREKAAPIAVKAIVEFIQHNSGAYDVVELFVKKRFEFALYKELLEKSSTEK